MEHKIRIYNPAEYTRQEDIIEVDLTQEIYKEIISTDLKSRNIILNLNNDTYKFSVNGQIDDMYFPKVKRLSFLIGHIDPSLKKRDYTSEYYFNINQSLSPNIQANTLNLYYYDNSKKIIAFEIKNEALSCNFSLAGFLSTVKLSNREILDGNPNANLHSSQKRVMQIIKISINNPSWWQDCKQREIDIDVLNYGVTYFNTGSVKSSVTIATEPFIIRTEPSANLGYPRHSIYGRLYRTISLYKGKNFLIEEISLLMNKDKNKLLNHIGKEVEFIPYYHSWLNFGVPIIKHHSETPDWFLIKSIFVNLGYGFAANTCIDEDIKYDDDNNFFWKLQSAKKHRCIHMFMREGIKINYSGEKADYNRFEHYIGHQWYETIFKPLEAYFLI